MKRANRRPCPIAGCKATRGADQLLCRDHWFQVPADLRERIWSLYRSQPGTEAHTNAVFVAIRHVSQLERAKRKGGES